MDTSEGPAYDGGAESPTQVNEDRSYDRYEDPASLPSTSLGPTQDPGGFGDGFLDRSLNENDSGAVKFGSMHSGGLDFESPTANDGERRRTNGLSRFISNSDNDPVSTAGGFAPETPAPLPKNPFAGKFQTPLVAGSQLFAQTPFSAAFNQASPTSSRPSPSDLLAQQAAATTPHMGISSPAKNIFSNLGEQTPMPMVMFHALSTPSTSRYGDTTPYPRESTVGPAAIVQQSSPTTRRKKPPAPIEEYEPMRQSQERRHAAAEVRPEPGSSSGDEADDASQQRQRIVRQKKEEATRILSTISMSGTTLRAEIVEVPASTKKEARPRSQGRQPGSRMLEMCPESDPSVIPEPAAIAPAATTAKSIEGPRSSVPESEVYEDVSFPPSIIDAPIPDVLPATKTPSSSAAFLPEMALPATEQGRPPLHPKSSINETDAIPETSPAGKWPTVATSRTIVPQTSDAAEAPTLSASTDPEQTLPSQRNGTPSLLVHKRRSQSDQLEEVFSLLKQGARQDVGTDAATSSPPIPASSASSMRSQRKRARYSRGDEIRNGRTSLAASVSSVDRSASSLSDLSATPTQLSREGTPITANDSDLSTRGSEKKHDVAAATAASADDDDDDDDSPLIPRRQTRRKTPSLPKVEQELGHGYAKASTSTKEGPSPFRSGSTDELAASPALRAAPSRNVRTSRRFTRSASTKTPSTLASAALRPDSPAPGLFSGMVFVVSFQSRRKGEGSTAFAKREKQGKELQARIQDAGGRILPDGFEDLFRPPQIVSGATSRSRTAPDAASSTSSSSGSSSELQLLPRAADSGFTALITDGHSRKAKYMQALALGLPCLAPRWVTTCLDRNELVDWAPYLLCAGESSFLGGAMRSRNLVSYDASTARLADVIQTRGKLLGGLTILIVPGKAAERTREPYAFLAHVLGAGLSRAHSIQEAREHLKAMEDAGRPCDWVYTDEETELDGLFQDRARPAARKKRKRSASGGDDDLDRAPAPVKTLSDERFIQSLIFGELIEEDDLGR